MGEYASYNGNEIKIGTCEDMYYLRAQDCHKVRPVPHSLDPRDPDLQNVLRFRFPWPEEDQLGPGQYESAFITQGLHIPVPEDVTHGTLQFGSNPGGYLVSLPCPESKEAQALPFKIGKNGNMGSVKIVQQAWRGEGLALVAQCGGCGNKFYYPTLEEAKPVIDALEEHAIYAENRGDSQGGRYREIVQRIKDGYRSRFAPYDQEGYAKAIA